MSIDADTYATCANCLAPHRTCRRRSDRSGSGCGLTAAPADSGGRLLPLALAVAACVAAAVASRVAATVTASSVAPSVGPIVIVVGVSTCRCRHSSRSKSGSGCRCSSSGSGDGQPWDSRGRPQQPRGRLAQSSIIASGDTRNTGQNKSEPSPDARVEVLETNPSDTHGECTLVDALYGKASKKCSWTPRRQPCLGPIPSLPTKRTLRCLGRARAGQYLSDTRSGRRSTTGRLLGGRPCGRQS